MGEGEAAVEVYLGPYSATAVSIIDGAATVHPEHISDLQLVLRTDTNTELCVLATVHGHPNQSAYLNDGHQRQSVSQGHLHPQHQPIADRTV